MDFKKIPIRHKDFNDYSEEVFSLLPEIPKSGIVQFRLLDITPDRRNPGRYLLPNAEFVPIHQEIFDRGHGRYIRTMGINNVTLTGEITTLEDAACFRANTFGHITINLKSSPAQQRLFVYLYLHNWNKSFPDRDNRFPALYEYVNEVATAKEQNALRKLRLKANAAIMALPETDVFAYAATFQIGGTRNVDVLRSRLCDIADNNPSRILEAAIDTTASVTQDIQTAISAGVIKKVNKDRQYKWADDDLVIFEAPPQFKMEEAFVDYLLHNDSGRTDHRTMMRLVREKEKA